MNELTLRFEVLFEICTAVSIAVFCIYINYSTPELTILLLIVTAIWILIVIYIAAIVIVEPTPSKNRELPRRGQIGIWVMIAGVPVADIFDNSILGVLVVLAGLLLVLNSIQLRERRFHAMETSEKQEVPE